MRTRRVHSDAGDLWRPRAKRVRDFSGDYRYRAAVQRAYAAVLAEEPRGFPSFQPVDIPALLRLDALAADNDNGDDDDEEVVECGDAADLPRTEHPSPDHPAPAPAQRPNHIANFLGSRKRKREAEGQCRRTRQLGNSSSKREFLAEWRYLLPSGEKITWVEEATAQACARPLLAAFLRAEREEQNEAKADDSAAIPLARPMRRRSDPAPKSPQHTNTRRLTDQSPQTPTSADIPPSSPVSPARSVDEPHTPRKVRRKLASTKVESVSSVRRISQNLKPDKAKPPKTKCLCGRQPRNGRKVCFRCVPLGR